MAGPAHRVKDAKSHGSPGAPGGGARDAQTRSRTGLQSLTADRRAARLATAVASGRNSSEGGVDLDQVVACGIQQSPHLGTFERDRRALGIVFVVGVGVS